MSLETEQAPKAARSKRWLGAIAIIFACTAGLIGYETLRPSGHDVKQVAIPDDAWILAHFREQPTYMTDDQRATAIITGLQDPKTLAGWQLCAAELRAEATIRHGLVEGYELYEPKPWSHSAIEFVESHRKVAKAIEAAIPQAKAAGTPCLASDRGDKLRAQEVTIQTEAGPRVAVISDLDVAYHVQPLEYHGYSGSCISKYKANRSDVEQRPLGPATSDHAAWTAYNRHYYLIDYEATIALLEQSPFAHC